MPTWLSAADLVLILICFLFGYLGAILQTWTLHRRTYSLECAVVDLENKVLVEIKRRAGQERQKDSRIDQEILKAAQNAKPEPVLPWWTKIKAQ